MLLKTLLFNTLGKLKIKKMNSTLNYSDQIIRSIMVTTFVKKKFNLLFMMLLTIIIRTILGCMVCYCIQFNMTIDFFLHSFFYIIIIFYLNFIFDILNTRKKYFYKITKSIVNNYSIENYKKWKRNIFLSLSLCAIIMLLFVEINSYYLIYYICQNIVIYCAVDVIENNKLQEIMKQLQKKKPKQTQFTKLKIVDNYYDISESLITENKTPIERKDSNDYTIIKDM